MSTQDQEKQSLNVPPPPTPGVTGRIRSHSLKPQHSRLDYERRKSAADITLIGDHDIAEIPKTTPPSWFKRRFTLFTIEQPISEKRQMTTDRFSFCDEKSCAELLKQKRPSLIAQMLESFVRRISSRKKKHPEREDETIIDPVYETLKEAAETRKRTIANYLQQRQQTLNKQTSLNSQGSSELDIQPSPRVVRHTDATSPTQPQASSLSGNQNSVPQFLPVVDSYQSSRSKK